MGRKKFYLNTTIKPCLSYETAADLFEVAFGHIYVLNNRGRVLAEFWF